MSKLVPLQAGRGYAIVDDEDYPLVKDSKWYWVDGYAARVIRVDAKRTWELMHRLIAQPPPDMDTDHRDRNRLNNQRLNLRTASRSQNVANTGAHADNQSGYRGVFRHQESWRAVVCRNGKKHDAGVHPTRRLAALAYNAKARELFGEFAYQNTVEEDDNV